MGMPVNAELKVNHPYGIPHANSVFQHDFRSKAAADTYFNAFGAGTITWYGTENVDYQFDSELGFRTLTNNGGANILISNIVTGLPLTHFFNNGFTFDFQALTSEWIAPEYSPPLYANPVTDLQGTGAGAMDGHFLMQFWYNTNLSAGSVVSQDDLTQVHPGGKNRMTWFPCTNGATRAGCGRNLSYKNKGKFLSCRLTAIGSFGNMWIDGMSAVPPNAGNTSTYSGEKFTIPWHNSQAYSPVTGNVFLVLGAYNGALVACNRWIRNIRLFNAPTNNATHPQLAREVTFGDSYSASSFGASVIDNTTPIGGYGYLSEYSSVPDAYFGDVDPAIRYQQLLNNNGFQVGGMYSTGFGGRNFYDTLNTQGFLAQLIKYMPTHVFTFGLHNDVTPIYNATTNIAALQSLLINTYLKPVFDTGCKGWGFVIPAASYDIVIPGQESAHNSIATMLLGLPAAFGTAFPQYAGRVKVSDLRTTMGQNWTNNQNWKTYWTPAEQTHPSLYGQNMFAEACAKMTLGWLSNS